MNWIILFLSTIIVVLSIVMTRRKTVKRTDRVRTRNLRLKKSLKELRETFKTFRNDPEVQAEVERCNKILVDNENNCNCFTDSSKEFPQLNVKGCMMEKSKDPNCREYNSCKKMFMKAMSGSEPNYDPDSWSSPIIEGSHNCYTYFLNDQLPEVARKCRTLCKKKNNCKKKISECSKLKPQPGHLASRRGDKKLKNRKFTCKDMTKKILADNYNKKLGKSVIHPVPFMVKCPKHHYKGAVVVDPNETYHFYRQDSNVRWSHKQGTLRVENVDASGKPIYAPHLADMNYNKAGKSGGINYSEFCNYMCVPNNNYLDTGAV